MAVLVILCIGLFSGAVLGSYFGRGQEERTSSATILLTPMSNNVLSSPNADDPQAPVTDLALSGEMAFLSSSSFVDDIQRRLGFEQRPSFKAIQEGRSPVITLTGGGATLGISARVLQAALDEYAEHQKKRADAQLATALKVIDRERADIAAHPGDQSVLLSHIDQLRIDALLHAARGPGYEVLQDPHPDQAVGTPPWVLDSILGAVVGGLIGVGSLIAIRATSRRVSKSDVHDLVDRVLEPMVGDSRGQKIAGRPIGESALGIGRLMLGQLSDRASIGERVIVVLGVSHVSGAHAIAASIHEAAKERGRALLFQRISDLTSESEDAEPLPFSTIVVDAGVLGEKRATDALNMATDVVVVVREGVDSVDSLKLTVAVLTDQVPAVVTVVTRGSFVRKWLYRMRGLRTRHKTDEGVNHPE